MTNNEEENTEAVQDPFAPENLAIAQFIITARLYDVAMALLSKLEPAVADELLETHARGALLGPSPAFIGEFITDLLNAEGDLLNEEPVGLDESPERSNESTPES